MLISIIITVFNKENQLPRCIESVINQTYKKLDIIVINDGSSDNSEGIISEYLSDNRIRYHKQENKGIASTRNRGIELSKGDYIFFMDGDDELPSDSIQQLANKLGNNTDIVVGNFVYKSKSNIRKNSKLKEGRYENEVEIKSFQLKYNMFTSNGRPLSSVCNKLYDKGFLLNNNIFFEKDVLAEDRLFNLYCYCNYPNLVIVNKYTYIVNLIENSRSRTYIEDFYMSIVNLTVKFHDFLSGNDILKENLDLEFFNFISDIESTHRYILRYSPYKYKDIKKYTKKIKGNQIFNNILKNGLNKKYFNKIQLNNKKWFLVVYVKIIVFLPELILPYLYLSNLALIMKSKIKRK